MAIRGEENDQPNRGHRHEGAEPNHHEIEHGHAMLPCLGFVSAGFVTNACTLARAISITSRQAAEKN